MRSVRCAKLSVELAREQSSDDVTVVLGVRNRQDHRLPNALRCLRLQNWAPELIHIVVVDYGSDPSRVPWLEDHCVAARDVLLRVETSGPWNRSHCLNIGIARACTRYVMPTGVDIMLAPDYVRRAIELLRDGGRTRASRTIGGQCEPHPPIGDQAGRC